MPETDAQTTKAIHALDLEFASLFNAKKWDRLVSTFYAEDARFLPPGAPLIQGRAGIRAFAAQLGGAMSDVRVQPGPVVVSGDLAVTHGTYTAKVATPAGTVDDRGKFLEAWRREADGSWKCFLDTFTSDIEGH